MKFPVTLDLTFERKFDHVVLSTGDITLGRWFPLGRRLVLYGTTIAEPEVLASIDEAARKIWVEGYAVQATSTEVVLKISGNPGWLGMWTQETGWGWNASRRELIDLIRPEELKRFTEKATIAWGSRAVPSYQSLADEIMMFGQLSELSSLLQEQAAKLKVKAMSRWAERLGITVEELAKHVYPKVESRMDDESTFCLVATPVVHCESA